MVSTENHRWIKFIPDLLADFSVLVTGSDFSCESLFEAYKKKKFFFLFSDTLDDSIAHTATAKKKLLF